MRFGNHWILPLFICVYLFVIFIVNIKVSAFSELGFYLENFGSWVVVSFYRLSFVIAGLCLVYIS